MRALLDTNVLISAVLFGGTPRRILVAALRGEFDLLTSPALMHELEDVLFEKFGFSRAAARATRSEIEALADVVEPTEVPRVCRDPDDDEVLAAALAGGAEAIVTGDTDLLGLKLYEGVRVLTPAQFDHKLRGG